MKIEKKCKNCRVLLLFYFMAFDYQWIKYLLKMEQIIQYRNFDIQTNFINFVSEKSNRLFPKTDGK